MKREIILLFSVNIMSAIGYSLIAPLYPSIAKERGIGEHLCGLIISMFALSNFFATPFCPMLISKYGRKNIFYFALSLEVFKIIK
jgi:predicted MFS family arabinose efflux permease